MRIKFNHILLAITFVATTSMYGMNDCSQLVRELDELQAEMDELSDLESSDFDESSDDRSSDKKPYEQLNGHAGNVNCISMLPWQFLFDDKDEPQMVSCSDDGILIFWYNGSCIDQVYAHTKPINKVRVVEGKKHSYVVSCSDDKKIKIWDGDTKELVKTLRGNAAPVLDVLWVNRDYLWLGGKKSPVLVSAAADGKVCIWDANYFTLPLMVLTWHKKPVRCLLQLDDRNGEFIASGSDDCKVIISNTFDGECARILTGHQAPVTALHKGVVENKRIIISGDKNGVIKLWDYAEGKCIHTFKSEHDGAIAGFGDCPFYQESAEGFEYGSWMFFFQDTCYVTAYDYAAQKTLWTKKLKGAALTSLLLEASSDVPKIYYAGKGSGSIFVVPLEH